MNNMIEVFIGKKVDSSKIRLISIQLVPKKNENGNSLRPFQSIAFKIVFINIPNLKTSTTRLKKIGLSTN